jgi:hypothetical protein
MLRQLHSLMLGKPTLQQSNAAPHGFFIAPSTPRAPRAHRRGRWLSFQVAGSASNNRSAAGLTIRLGPSSREAVKVRRGEAIRSDVWFEWLSRGGEFSANTARLTACWAGDIVADKKIGDFNCLFSAGSDRPAFALAGSEAMEEIVMYMTNCGEARD